MTSIVAWVTDHLPTRDRHTNVTCIRRPGRKRCTGDIAAEKIRERYEQSRINLIGLMSKITELRVYDNSLDADPHPGRAPQPVLILHLTKQKIVHIVDLAKTLDWAKPMVAAAIKPSKDLPRVLPALWHTVIVGCCCR